jgi:hypothetical protein
MTQKNTTAPDESAAWYNERRTDALRQVEQSLSDLETRYSTIEQSYQAAELAEQQSHKGYDDMSPGASRALVQALQDKQRYEKEADEVKNAYSTLQAEKQRLEQRSDPQFSELLNGSSEKSQLFLRTFRHKLENNPNALKQLLYADARAKAVGLKPDSNVYFRSLEAAVGLEADDRSTDDFFKSEKPASDRARGKHESQERKELSPEQVRFCKDSGIPEESYAAYAQSPFSQAASAVDEPTSFDTRAHKSMEVQLDDEAPAKRVDVSKYKAPNPKTSVNISATEKEICVNMASVTGRPVNEVLREFAANKIALRDGKAGHYQLYADKLASEGHR